MIKKNSLLEELDKLNLTFGIRQTAVFIFSIALSYFITRNVIISLLGAFVPLLYFLIPKQCVKLQPVNQMLLLYLTIVLIALLGSLANLNIIARILLNTIVPFLIVLIFMDEKNIYGYVIYYAVFLYVQFMNITLDIFPIYLIATFIGVATAYIFYEIIWKEYGKFSDADMIGVQKMFLIKRKLIKEKLKNTFNIDDWIFRFAIRISIATVLTITFSNTINLTEVYWLSKAACFTLVPVWNQINVRAIKRFKGTIIGCMLYFLFALLMPNKIMYFAVVILALVLALSYLPKQYMTQYYILSTFVSISLIFESDMLFLISKIIYVMIGVFVAVLVNQFAIPKKNDEISICET